MDFTGPAILLRFGSHSSSPFRQPHPYQSSCLFFWRRHKEGTHLADVGQAGIWSMQVLEQKCRKIFLTTSKTCNYTIFQKENSITFGHVTYPEYVALPSAGVSKWLSYRARTSQSLCWFLLKFEGWQLWPWFQGKDRKYYHPRDLQS